MTEINFYMDKVNSDSKQSLAVDQDVSEVKDILNVTKNDHANNEARRTAESIIRMKEQKRYKREFLEIISDDLKSNRNLFNSRLIQASRDSPSSDRFFGSGIKLFMLRTTEGRYFNSVSLLKLFIFEPIFINLQMFPTTQILLITFIQIVFFSLFIRCAFVSKIFESRVRLAALVVNETAVTVFLAIGLLMHSVDIKND